MTFDNPFVLYFLFFLLLCIPVIILRYRKSRENAALFASAAPSGERAHLFRELRLRMIISDIFFFLFSGFVIIALAGPRWGLRIVTDYHRGVDLVMAFDLSRSMNVRDCLSYSGDPGEEASRLERGLGIAGELGSALGDVRLGTAAGKGRGVLAVPLTYDHEAFFSFLFGLNGEVTSGRGTNLESLINAALTAFRDSVPHRRSVILFSDGEALSGSLERAAKAARQAGISLCTVGLGSDRGGTVPAAKNAAAPDGFLLDADGKAVVSGRRANALRAAAERTGGVYVDGNRTDAVRFLREYVNSFSAESGVSGHRREPNPRWQIFVLAAMACLAGARVMGFTRRRNTNSRTSDKRPSKGGVLAGFIFLVLFSSCARTQGRLLLMEGNFFYSRGFYTEAISSYLAALNYEDSAPYAEYGLASSYFTLNESAAALERYAAAEKSLLTAGREEHAELRFRIYYNTGIIYFERREYGEAVNAFREALKIDSSRIEAKRNLELSLLTRDRSNSSGTASPEESGEGGREDPGGNGSVLFEYLKAREQEQWKSREWAGEDDFSGPDY